MSAAHLLERLQRVTRCSSDRWRAVCPAHESRHHTQSLAIRELPDGTILLKCHAGCGGSDVVAAVGLQLADLFPRDYSAPNEPRRARKPGHWHALREAVQTLHHECLIVAIGAEDIARGAPLSLVDVERVALAAGRIRAAVEACT